MKRQKTLKCPKFGFQQEEVGGGVDVNIYVEVCPKLNFLLRVQPQLLCSLRTTTHHPHFLLLQAVHKLGGIDTYACSRKLLSQTPTEISPHRIIITPVDACVDSYQF